MDRIIVGMMIGLVPLFLSDCSRQRSETNRTTQSDTVWQRTTDSTFAKLATQRHEAPVSFHDTLSIDSTVTHVAVAGRLFYKSPLPTSDQPITGSEPCAFYRDQRNSLFLYSRYAVAVYEAQTFAGDSLFVYPFNLARDSTRAGYLIDSGPLYSSAKMGVWFFGILHQYMFLDLGTGPERGIAIYELGDTAKPIFHSAYFDTVYIISPDSLSFSESTNRHPTEQDCPKVREWRSQGFDAVVVERVVLSLKTFYKRRTGEIHCETMQ